MKKSERKEKTDLKKRKTKANEILTSNQIENLPNWLKTDIEKLFIIGTTNKVILSPEGKKFHLDNKLNDLSGAEWNFFLRSVINTRYATNGKDSYAHNIRKIHPSPKPPQLMRDLIKFFTKENEYVLDYFSGVGGTLLGASLCDRNALGIELNQNYVETYIAANREMNLLEQKVIVGDSKEILKEKILINDYLKNNLFSLIAIDPPYGDMMSREKTGEVFKKFNQKEATPFTNSKNDLGNMKKSDFMESLLETISLSTIFLKERGHIIVFIKDFQPKNGNTNILHACLIEEINKLSKISYVGMKIWVDESINLYPYGYPFSYVSNQLHQYILFFRKD